MTSRAVEFNEAIVSVRAEAKKRAAKQSNPRTLRPCSGCEVRGLRGPKVCRNNPCACRCHRPKAPIERWPHICGGDPCITGTDIPTATVFALFKEEKQIADIATHFTRPLTVSQVNAAIAFELGRRHEHAQRARVKEELFSIAKLLGDVIERVRIEGT